LEVAVDWLHCFWDCDDIVHHGGNVCWRKLITSRRLADRGRRASFAMFVPPVARALQAEWSMCKCPRQERLAHSRVCVANADQRGGILITSGWFIGSSHGGPC
jgi:hypothetical protein